MGTTTNFSFPYPEPTDDNDVPADLNALATAIDTEMGAPTVLGTDWTSWSFSVPGLTVGNGTANYFYRYLGGDCMVMVYINFGSTTAITTSDNLEWTFTGAGQYHHGSGWVWDDNQNSRFPIFVRQDPSTAGTMQPLCIEKPLNTTGSSWQVNDQIMFTAFALNGTPSGT